MNPWTRLVDAFAAEERGTTLALWRIAVGAVLWVDLTSTWLRGAHSVVFHPPAAGGFRPLPPASHWLWSLAGPPGAVHADVALAAAWLGASAVVLGIGTRVAAAIALVSAQALWSLNGYSGGGHDRMITISLFVLVLAHSDATLSLRSKLATGAWRSSARVKRWPRALITWNLTLIYTATGLVKFNGAWMPTGSMDAVYRALSMPHYARNGSALWVAQHLTPLTQLGAVVTLIWELTFLAVPLWLLLRASRWGPTVARVDVRALYVAVGLVMHGTLFVFLDLGPFGPITVAWYLVLFRPDELERWLPRLAPSGIEGTART